jgi:hypothetical protein
MGRILCAVINIKKRQQFAVSSPRLKIKFLVPLTAARRGGKRDNRREWGQAGRLFSPGSGSRDTVL